MIKYNRIKDLREDHDYKQEEIAKHLEVERSVYAKWENGDRNIPLSKVDSLSVMYNVPLSYILGQATKYEKDISVKKMNYNKLLKRLSYLKEKNNMTYQDIAEELKISRSNCYKYFKGEILIPTHILVGLSNLFNINIDELCDKV